MLLPNPESRITSQDLCSKLEDIVARAQITLNRTAVGEPSATRKQREHLENLLKEIDDDTEGTDRCQQVEPTRPSPSGLPIIPGSLKTQMNNLPLKKASYRYDLLKPRLGSTGPPTILEIPTIVTPDETHDRCLVPQHHSFPEGDIATSSKQPQDPRQSESNLESQHTAVDLSNGRANPRLSQTGRNNNPYNPQIQNAIQAREHIERKRQRESLGIKLPRRRPPTDEFLKKYFSNRDIVG